ncbi:PAAR-like protein [Chryseobacterium joostei]|uniref:PAAR-like protein n=1 Tax=Chryseobacterium joostei TaxID=112234 RepID=UPI0023F488AE|nr:PAAR-like protein [Chryseobacterium joostei]
MGRLDNDGDAVDPATQNPGTTQDNDQMKADNRQKMDDKRAEDERKEKAEAGLKVVIDTATLECTQCTNPKGIMVVNYNTPTIQEKKTATVKEKGPKSLVFTGNCLKSPYAKLPCATVMNVGEWKGVGTYQSQEQLVLLQQSTIPCKYGQVDIKITDSGQIHQPESIEAKGAPVPEQKEKQTCGIQYRKDVTCVKYGSAYGPLYSGSLKLGSYKNWSTIVSSGKVSVEEKEIILAMSENEGNMDAIQSYDSEALTVGAMQKTLTTDGYGELPIQMWEFKQDYPDKFKELFENCGWKVKEIEIPQKNKKVIKKYQAYYNDTTGSALKTLIRKGFDAKTNKKNVVCAPIEPFINACKDADFQGKQIVDFIKRLHSAINKKPTGYTNSIKDFVKSKLGKATVLDHDVNRPGHVSNCFRDALNQFFAANKKVSKDPEDWKENHATYEKDILEIYGPLRGRKPYTMTSASDRYTKLKSKL